MNENILENENILFEIKEAKVNVKTNDEINEKYKKGEFRIVTEQARYPIKSIPDMLKSDDYKTNPEYQRRKRWSLNKKSKLIESFIMNVPLPPIFLYEYEYAKFEVMDGLQRLTAIDDFYNNRFKLVGLEYWSELDGLSYQELPSEIKKGIDRRYLSSIILLEETAKTLGEAQELKQIVFERLNSGGERINPQESRNALYNGTFNQLCIKLAENKYFREMWLIPIKEKDLVNNKRYNSMSDVELVLRFFAYRYIDKLHNMSSIEDFLDEYLRQSNDYSPHILEILKEMFNETVEIIYELFRDRAFYMPKYERTSSAPQKTVYDPLMQSISKIYKHKTKILENKDNIIQDIYKEEDIYINKDKDIRLFNGRNNLVSAVEERISYYDSIFSKYV